MEWKSSVWGEGAHMGNICLCLCGQQRMRMSVGFQLESPYRLSSQVAFLLRGQPGMECGRWGGKRAHSLLPLPGLPSCACDIQENAQEPKTSLFLLCCIKAAVRSRLISDLRRFSSFFSMKHILFLEFWQVFIIIFFRFSMWLFLFYMCKQYVQVFCPNQIGARWQSDCICPVWFLTCSSSKSHFWLRWLFCLTSLAMKTRALAHPVVGCLYLPHLPLLRVPGLPAGSIWQGQLLAKLCLGYLIGCRVCMGWGYAFSYQKRAFA